MFFQVKLMNCKLDIFVHLTKFVDVTLGLSNLCSAKLTDFLKKIIGRLIDDGNNRRLWP